jgi:SAM-dependent methyltransferase
MMYSPARQCVDDFLRENWPPLPHSGTVLDVGAGPQRSAFRIPSGRVVRMDLVPGGHYLGDVQMLPHPDATFDVVKCTQMLYLVDFPDDAVREFSRVLKPGGWLLATVPYLHPPAGARDWFRLSAPHWGCLVHECGFGQNTVEALGGPWSGLCQLMHLCGPRGVRRLGRMLAPLARAFDVGREPLWPLAWGIIARKESASWGA